MVETDVSLTERVGDTFNFEAESFSDVAGAVAEGFRIKTSDEGLADELDGREFEFRSNGRTFFTSELESSFNSGFSEVNTQFEKFKFFGPYTPEGEYKTGVSLEPSELLERTNIKSLPKDGLANARDVFRALGVDEFSIRPVQETKETVNNSMPGTDKNQSDNNSLGLLFPLIGVLGLIYYVVFK
jgi:hypothetical protein